MIALARHSTAAFVLKPAAIAAAAEADLLLRHRKQGGLRSQAEPYIFHRAHVVRASCALDLIDRAIRDRYSGVWSHKRITVLVYADDELLWAARRLLSIEATGNAEAS